MDQQCLIVHIYYCSKNVLLLNVCVGDTQVSQDYTGTGEIILKLTAGT